jgi:SRSO17 transposase
MEVDMSVGQWSGSLLDWEGQLAGLKDRLAPVFGRRELRETAGAFVDGLLSGVERKTGWLMAEQAGLERPWRMQALLGRSKWDADALRDEVRDYALEVLADEDGVLVVDETGFVKKGEHSVGVARQYTGTAGRIENVQVGVFLAYAGRYGQALIDRRLYLPKVWADDGDRRAVARIPEDIGFATKPAIACDMLAAALDTGMACAWVLADAVYGSDSKLRSMLQNRGQAYVLAVRSNHRLRFVEDGMFVHTDPLTMADGISTDAWVMHSAGEGTKGVRRYEWSRLPLGTGASGWERWVLFRRSIKDPTKRAYYFVYAPAGTTLAELAGVAGLRWTIEECFQRAKDDLGLDHCEARSWHGWNRHMTLVMATLAFLARLSAQLRHEAWSKPNKRSPPPIAA